METKKAGENRPFYTIAYVGINMRLINRQGIRLWLAQ